MRFEPKLPDETVNYSTEHPLKEFVKIGGTLFAGIVSLYFILGWSVDLLASHISPELERKISKMLETRLPKEGEDATLEKLAESLGRCAPLPYAPRVRISDSKEVNAYALPGGVVVVNRGLLKEMASQNELAFILAHEFGHLKHRDHLRGMGRSLVALSLGALLGVSEAPDVLGSGLQFGESRFSQAQETAADLYALDVLQCRYGHVGGATDFFERHKDKDPAKWFLFASHPELVERIERLNAQSLKRGYPMGTLLPVPKAEEE